MDENTQDRLRAEHRIAREGSEDGGDGGRAVLYGGWRWCGGRLLGGI
jgi:hypothetical protein